MFRIIYFSGETSRFTAEGLENLAIQSKRKNTLIGVTGILLYCQGNFLQVLEGEDESVRNIFGLIRRDARHRRVITVVEEPIQARDFASWSMAFRNLDFVMDLPEGIQLGHFQEWNEMNGTLRSESVRKMIGLFTDSTNC